MVNRQLVETLQEIHFLRDVDREHLEKLAEIATVRSFEPLQVVFQIGGAATNFYLVAAGHVSLDVCAPGIGCKRILTVVPGEILGWSALLDNARLTATARTIEATTLVELPADALRSICEQNLKLGYEFLHRTMHALTTRLNATRMQLLDVYGPQLPSATAAAGENDGR